MARLPKSAQSPAGSQRLRRHRLPADRQGHADAQPGARRPARSPSGPPSGPASSPQPRPRRGLWAVCKPWRQGGRHGCNVPRHITPVMVSTQLCGVGASNSFCRLNFLPGARHIMVRSTEALQRDQQGLVFMPDRQPLAAAVSVWRESRVLALHLHGHARIGRLLSPGGGACLW